MTAPEWVRIDGKPERIIRVEELGAAFYLHNGDVKRIPLRLNTWDEQSDGDSAFHTTVDWDNGVDGHRTLLREVRLTLMQDVIYNTQPPPPPFMSGVPQDVRDEVVPCAFTRGQLVIYKAALEVMIDMGGCSSYPAEARDALHSVAAALGLTTVQTGREGDGLV